MPFLELILGLAATLLAAWLVVLLLFLLVRPKGMDMAEAKRFVPDVVRLVKDLAGDQSLGPAVRWRLLFLSAYLASPIDLVPDFVPVLGAADDVILVALVLRSVIRRAGSSALDEHWRGTRQGRLVIRRLAEAAEPYGSVTPLAAAGSTHSEVSRESAPLDTCARTGRLRRR